jgi:DNA repair exonuclease SbcCD nuclease subunit
MLARGGWDYVALGHYHVQREVSPRVWYSGSLEYVSTNPWGELEEERKSGSTGKGWLMVELPVGTVERRPITLARRFIDLPHIDGSDRSAAELDAGIAAALSAVPGGHADQVIRQVVRDVPRHIAREMDHAMIRRYKAEALHYLLDLRRPVSQRETGVGSPGRRQTLPELVEDYLGRRLLPGEVDREAFVRAGVDLIQTVERERLEG